MNRKLPVVSSVDVGGKNVIVRADLEADGLGDPRFAAAKEMVEYLKGRGAAKIKVIGHEGQEWMAESLGVETDWNIRRDSREVENSEESAGELARGFEVYVNEAFGTSHRKHTSIVALPQAMRRQGKKACAGLRFEKEIEKLDQIANSKKQKLLVVGGVKIEDKERYARQLESQGWRALRGGLLPGAELRGDGLDIAESEIARFEVEIEKAEVVVAAGVMGKYEEVGAEEGTKRVLQAIARAKAYKVAGGGDIEAAIAKYGLTEKFDWISVGGGAMLEYLATGTLPGMQALVG